MENRKNVLEAGMRGKEDCYHTHRPRSKGLEEKKNPWLDRTAGKVSSSRETQLFSLGARE